MQFSVRPAILPQDYAAMAAVLAAESPGWSETAEELAHEDAGRDPRYYHATFVAESMAEKMPTMIGVAFVGHETLAHQAGKFLINLRVDPAWQGQGVGKALYQAILDHLDPLAPQILCADVWHAHPRTARFLGDRGFVETWRRSDLYLEVADFDATPYAGLEENLRTQGIVIRTYADLADDPDRLAKLYKLDWALWQDIPYFGQTVVKRSLEQFANAEVHHPKFIADACFIAVKDDELIGYSNLSATDTGFSIEMTGVLRLYRGQGVATLLKLYGIQYTQAHGNGRLSTVNDAVNTAVLALNQKFGFLQEGAMLRFTKRIG